MIPSARQANGIPAFSHGKSTPSLLHLLELHDFIVVLALGNSFWPWNGTGQKKWKGSHQWRADDRKRFCSSLWRVEVGVRASKTNGVNCRKCIIYDFAIWFVRRKYCVCLFALYCEWVYSALCSCRCIISRAPSVRLFYVPLYSVYLLVWVCVILLFRFLSLPFTIFVFIFYCFLLIQGAYITWHFSLILPLELSPPPPSWEMPPFAMSFFFGFAFLFFFPSNCNETVRVFSMLSSSWAWKMEKFRDQVWKQ